MIEYNCFNGANIHKVRCEERAVRSGAHRQGRYPGSDADFHLREERLSVFCLRQINSTLWDDITREPILRCQRSVPCEAYIHPVPSGRIRNLVSVAHGKRLRNPWYRPAIGACYRVSSRVAYIYGGYAQWPANICIHSSRYSTIIIRNGLRRL